MIIPLDAARQRHGTIDDLGRDAIAGDGLIPVEYRTYTLGELDVARYRFGFPRHDDVIDDGGDAHDVFGGTYSEIPFGQRVDLAAQLHDALIHRDSEVRGRCRGQPFQFGLHRGPSGFVGTPMGRLRHLESSESIDSLFFPYVSA